MKKFKILFLFIVIFSSSLSANDNRREKLVSIINQELSEITRLNKQIGSRNPNLLLRLAELYLERARLTKEKENLDFLTLSPEKRQRTDKKRFFTKSREDFIKAQKTCYYILKRFKRFKKRDDVYYILAFNAKEFQQTEKARRFFVKAIKSSSRNSYTGLKSKLALGELYYNKKEYNKAIPLYEQALKKRDEKWWTKDAYNLAWCYFRTKQREKAIDLMEEVYRLSSNASYVDVGSLVERDLAYFYSESGRPQEAIKFYEKSGKDIAKNLLRVGKYLKEQGRFASAQKALAEAIKYSKDKKTSVAIDIELLSLYEKFGKTKSHLKTSQRLHKAYKEGSLDESDIEILKYHVTRMSALLQKQVADKRYKRQKRVRNRKAKYAVAYFKVKSSLEGNKNFKSMFHTAETLFAVKKYSDAIEMYNRAYEGAKVAGNSKIASLALNGMLASLGRKGSKKGNRKYLIKAYNLYLSRSPRDKKAFTIYQRLFSAQYEAKDIPAAEKTLLNFKENFPKAADKQEAMLAKIMDHYRTTKNRAGIQKWVAKIKAREFKVSREYARRLQLLLLTIQFENVEKFNSKGNKVFALKGYREIYKSEKSSKVAKKNAAYNIAVLYYEAGRVQDSYHWAKIALDRMNDLDIKNFQSSFLLIASGLFSQRYFLESAEVYELTLDKLCQTKSKNKNIFFKNANILYLAEGKIDASIRLIKGAYRCGISANQIRESKFDLLKDLAKEKRWQTFVKVSAELEGDKESWANLIYLQAMLRDAYLESGRDGLARKVNKKILSFYRISDKKKIPLESLDVVAELKLVEVRKIANRLERTKLSYPEKKFNSTLKKKFKMLDELIEKALAVFKIGSGTGIVQTYSILVDAHEGLAVEINTFTPPKKSKEYISSFKKSMNEISGPIRQRAQEYKAEAKKKIVANKILSIQNHHFLAEKKIGIEPRLFPKKKGILMDRGGRR